ncbi:type II toxin-antitoxin system VapC family toxin [candidate division KSB1 bacterium]|nr:type II toxin-antitoxin system VapC family toxin [Gammaproteobacteria bacterium]NIR52952.1 type II toxin-antitoxin system VapC family toxin [candidate division KSB1 bacterium]NIS25264.1 type II toxin-antitoxin system VapC family toxin [candidate division KSB1 bacterium]NIT72168.1 type II toxin-antitoxin system VapC family toxin [candidate division KSB1 bacterium]NIU25973.1 type II toxin-antitoxin system VapC family toxin [candidate division KSB1 bacterium]
MREMFAIGFLLEPLQQEDFITAMSAQRRFGLLTNDALSVAIAQRLRAKAFASADKVFTGVQGLMVYAPGDLET